MAAVQAQQSTGRTVTSQMFKWTEAGLNMDYQEAVALIAVSLEALIHRHHVGPAEALTYMPVGLIKVALGQLDECGADTSAVRIDFAKAGFDLSEIANCAEISELNRADHDESDRAPSTSRVPTAIAEAIVAKFHEGWSKSRIAREFRLNRRTVIRICAGR